MTVNTTWILIAAGIFVGTYVVRALPFWMSGTTAVSPRFKRFLDVVPAAALGALIAPDAFAVLSVPLTLGILSFAGLLTFRGVNVTVVVAVSIFLTWGALVYLS